MGERVYLGLGGNMGDRLAHLRRAVSALARLPGTRVVKKSRVYQTAPVGPAQRDFYNAAAAIDTALEPRALLRAVKGIEKSLGRRAGRRWGPRPIDIDLLFFGRRRLGSRGLTLPHPRWRERHFVLAPLSDVLPRAGGPVSRRKISEMRKKLTDPGQSIRLKTARL